MNSKKQNAKSKTKDIKFPTFNVLRLTFNGFTLIELLVVITILGVLSSIGLGNFINSQMKGRDTQRKSDLHQLQNALEFFYNDKGNYPQASGNQILGCPAGGGACSWGGNSAFTDGKTVYFQKVPADPKGTLPYCYKVSSDQSKYQLFAKLENANDPDIVTGVVLTCGGNTYNFGAASSNTNVEETL